MRIDTICLSDRCWSARAMDTNQYTGCYLAVKTLLEQKLFCFRSQRRAPGFENHIFFHQGRSAAEANRLFCFVSHPLLSDKQNKMMGPWQEMGFNEHVDTNKLGPFNLIISVRKVFVNYI